MPTVLRGRGADLARALACASAGAAAMIRLPAPGGGRVLLVDARRRDARHHLAGRGRRPAAELRSHLRRRRGAAPGDAASDAGRAGVERGGHRPAARRQRHSRVGALSRAGVSGPRSSCCPTTASRRRWCDSVSSTRSRTTAVAAGATALEHPERQRCSGRRDRVSADASGAAGERLPRQRRVSPAWRRGRARLEGDSAVSPPSMLDDVRDAAASAARRPIRWRSSSVLAQPPAGRLRRPARSGADRRRSHALADPAARSSSRCRRGFSRCGFPGVDAVGHYFLRYAEPVGVWRRVGRRAAALRPRAGASTTASSTRSSAARSTRSALTICCSSSRRSAWSR